MTLARCCSLSTVSQLLTHYLSFSTPPTSTHPPTPPPAKNFLGLCAAGVYDGTRFHRNIKGFMIQVRPESVSRRLVLVVSPFSRSARSFARSSSSPSRGAIRRAPAGGEACRSMEGSSTTRSPPTSSIINGGSCPWRTLARTRTQASSSSRTSSTTTSTANTRCSGVRLDPSPDDGRHDDDDHDDDHDDECAPSLTFALARSLARQT